MKWKTVGTRLTEEEKEQFLECIKDYNKEKGTEVTVNKFLRRMILSYIKKCNKNLC